MANEIIDLDTFMHAGKALFTVQNKETKNRFTYKVIKDRKSKFDRWWVRVLAQHKQWVYLGCIKNGTFVATPASFKRTTDQSFIAFKFIFKYRKSITNSKKLVVYHEGRCGRCGLRLTVPESIESGFGPECIKSIR